ncbi:MAG: gamma-glutamyltransferase [Novosphingobium sp.]|nr:gamma-glutamyltransferase [Novosphingobium sp.]
MSMGWGFGDGYSSAARPTLPGERGAVSAAHPLAVAAGQAMLFKGGSAVDAAIAAQATLCVVSPDACGLGGDLFALVGDGGGVIAVNGAGAAPLGLTQASGDGATSVTVPGLAGGWAAMHDRWGRLALADCLAPAIRLAEHGHRICASVARAAVAQHDRLVRNGAAGWALCGLCEGDVLIQPALGAALRQMGQHGAGWFYHGDAAAAIARAVAAGGGALAVADLSAHATELADPIAVSYRGCEVLVQPSPTQGILLAMALQGLAHCSPGDDASAEHLCVELTEAAFAYRDRAADGASLLDEALTINPDRASLRGGPRAYLHTAGVATADADGLVVSSLVSLFDDFGSCVFVPELGITLNNRAGGFTGGANAAGPGKRPVHTLAPAMLRRPGRDGPDLLALATPGADGQVQTLLQVIDRIVRRGEDLARAIAAPRWRSEGGALLIEESHPARPALAARGHNLAPLPDGQMRFGALACAGLSGGQPLAVADWRRENWAGVA